LFAVAAPAAAPRRAQRPADEAHAHGGVGVGQIAAVDGIALLRGEVLPRADLLRAAPAALTAPAGIEPAYADAGAGVQQVIGQGVVVHRNRGRRNSRAV
jgi:hypothetical protein